MLSNTESFQPDQDYNSSHIASAASECVALKYVDGKCGDKVSPHLQQLCVIMPAQGETITLGPSGNIDGAKLVLNDSEAMVLPNAKVEYELVSDGAFYNLRCDKVSLQDFAYSELTLHTHTLFTKVERLKNDDLSKISAMLAEQLTTPCEHWFGLVESLSRFLVLTLLHTAQDQQQGRTTSRLSFDDFNKVKRLVESNYRRGVSLTDMSQEAGLSMSHFSRLFKFYLGESPKQFVNQFRIEKAKHMLHHDSVNNIADVAQLVGFPDQPHFGKVFKRLVGVSPGTFRKQHRA